MARRLAAHNTRFGAGPLLSGMVRAGLLLLPVIPLLVTPSTLFPFVVGKALFARVVIEITFALWLALIIYYPRHRPAKSWILGALALWVLVSLLAGLAGVSLTRSLWSTYERMQGVVDLLHWFAYILMAASVFRTPAGWRMLFTVNLGVCGLVSALGIGQHFGLLDSVPLSSTERLSSTVGNPTYMGAYAMTSVLAGLGLFWHSFGDGERGQPAPRNRAQRRRHRSQGRPEFRIDYLTGLRAFWILAMALSLWAMWLTATRGALVGMIAGVAAFALIYSLWGAMPRVRRVCWGLAAAAAAAVALLVIFGLNTASGSVGETEAARHRTAVFETGWLDDRSVRGRMESIRTGIDAWRERPLLGWGPENFLIAWGRHAAPDPDIVERFDQAHNKPVETLTTTGSVGLVAYLAVWVALGSAMLRSVRRRVGYEQLLAAALAATLASYFVQNLFLFDTPVTVMLFASLAAFAVSEEWRTTGGAARSRIVGALAGWGRWRPLPSAYRMLRAPAGLALVAVVLAALAAAGPVFYNGRQYSGGAATLQSRSAPSWEQRAAHYKRAETQFPGMANYPRLYLINDAVAIAESGYSHEFSDDEFGHIVARARDAGEQGLAVEPENWRFPAALARFYLAAAARDAEYIGPAQRSAAAAARLAPEIPEVQHTSERVEQLAADLADRFHIARKHNRLIYTKTPCSPADIDTRYHFFLHIYPANPGDLRLPAASRGVNDTESRPDFNNDDFAFAEHGALRDGRCTTARELPGYDISSIHTGQYLTDGDGRRLWQTVLSPAP